jgi:hypothetical protein
MIKKQKMRIIGAGTVALLAIAGGVFWFWHRSQTNTIQVESAKQFEAAPILEASPLEQVPAEEMTEEKQAELVAQEKTEAAKPGEEEKKEVPKDIAPKEFSIKSKLVSFGHEAARGRDIDTIVLHSSYGVDGDPYDVEDVIGLWKSYGVAPHYMIAREGTVYQLVADKDIAYHAGESKMPDGRKNVNDFSIGVEILNTKTDSYTSAQYQAAKDLISSLKKKYGKMEVVGHDTIAPGRKSDPWNFNWSKI